MKYEDIIQIPCTELNKYSQEDKENIADTIVNHYYMNGFPFYSLTREEMLTEYRYMVAYDVSALELENDELQQNMKGLSFVNSFHPQMWSTVCKNAPTPMDVYLDRDLFNKAIVKRMGLSVSKLVDFNIRKSLKVFNGVQNVSNFRPTVSKYMYKTYAGENARVLDPCAGYGGRLFGALSSSNVSSYTGVDPATASYSGNLEIVKTLNNIVYKLNDNDMFGNIQLPGAGLAHAPFEDLDLCSEYDFIFTSPPYFDIEKYSYEATQSWIRYPTFGE